MVEKYVVKLDPDFVAVEAPAAGNFTNQDLVILAGCVRAQARRMGKPVKVYAANSHHKHFLGRALRAKDFPGKSRADAKGAIKAALIAKCHVLGWSVKDGDAADACSLADYALSMQSRAHQVTSIGGLFRRQA
jgi:hypothetical protein